MKIADFGLVAESNVHTLTQDVGTTLYMAPDVFEKTYTNKIDIYRFLVASFSRLICVFSMGIVCFEMFLSVAEKNPRQQFLMTQKFSKVRALMILTK